MGTYSKRSLVELERRLVAADADKKALKKLRHTTRVLPTARELAAELDLPLAYVRRVAWEKKLDPFFGEREENDMWLAAYCVVALGWSVRDAAKELGFTHPSIEAFLHRHGWKRYPVWGNRTKKVLHIPAPLQQDGWHVKREPSGWKGDLQGYRIPDNYFTKKRR